jgi:hypothetical protein
VEGEGGVRCSYSVEWEWASSEREDMLTREVCDSSDEVDWCG